MPKKYSLARRVLKRIHTLSGGKSPRSGRPILYFAAYYLKIPPGGGARCLKGMQRRGEDGLTYDKREASVSWDESLGK
jgi:hypothetical protein